ncbi:hypothetical protein LIER_06601 [Lithospermum erythrorhizon]|uniref:Uncharacterized protein n=1 Tax=Lithospermum erythrorhizon TaxID=34254 RepID=A0AAV3P9R4_LITER
MRLHQAQNKITSIRDENDRLIEEYDEIKKVVIQFCKKLFTEPCHDVCDASMVSNVIDQRLTCDEVAMLNNHVTTQEIENVMLHMMGKAPGPDGFTTEFYKGSWSIVKGIVIEAIKTFFCYKFYAKECE